MNPVIFYAVCSALVINGKYDELASSDISERYTRLVIDEEFISVTRQRTTRMENIQKRVSIAAKYLYGE